MLKREGSTLLPSKSKSRLLEGKAGGMSRDRIINDMFVINTSAERKEAASFQHCQHESSFRREEAAETSLFCPIKTQFQPNLMQSWPRHKTLQTSWVSQTLPALEQLLCPNLKDFSLVSLSGLGWRDRDCSAPEQKGVCGAGGAPSTCQGQGVLGHCIGHITKAEQCRPDFSAF